MAAASLQTRVAMKPSNFRVWVMRFILICAATYFFVRVFLPAQTAMTSSYPAYYTAARLLVEGRWNPQVYDDAWFSARVLEITNGRISDLLLQNPPPIALVLVPIAWLDVTTSRIVWEWFNLGLAIG